MLTHVDKVHSAEHEIMEPFVLVPAGLLVTQQPLVVPIEIVVSVTNVLAVVSVTSVLAAAPVTDVLAATLSGSHDIGDSLMITSHHFFRN